jgi:hypothetical protein
VARFVEGQVLVACKSVGQKKVVWKVRRRVGVQKVVRVCFYPDMRKLDTRKCLVEHVFGTVKFWSNGSFLLLRGVRKVSGELSLAFLAYNMGRVLGVLGFDRVLAGLRGFGRFFCLFFGVLFVF